MSKSNLKQGSFTNDWTEVIPPLALSILEATFFSEHQCHLLIQSLCNIAQKSQSIKFEPSMFLYCMVSSTPQTIWTYLHTVKPYGQYPSSNLSTKHSTASVQGIHKTTFSSKCSPSGFLIAIISS